MGFSIHYRSTETMHPAQAYAIKQHAERLIDGYFWFSCEPVVLQQQTDGYLSGHSKPNFFPAEIVVHDTDLEGLPDGTVVTLAEVLCVLSREHGVDWDIGHDCQPDPIGCICDGIANSDLMEQLETVGSIGDLLDEAFDDALDAGDAAWDAAEIEIVDPTRSEQKGDDDEPRVLKFPGTE